MKAANIAESVRGSSGTTFLSRADFNELRAASPLKELAEIEPVSKLRYAVPNKILCAAVDAIGKEPQEQPQQPAPRRKRGKQQ